MGGQLWGRGGGGTSYNTTPMLHEGVDAMATAGSTVLLTFTIRAENLKLLCYTLSEVSINQKFSSAWPMYVDVKTAWD